MTPKEALRKLIEDNPNATEAELHDAFMEFVRKPENRDMQTAILTEVIDQVLDDSDIASILSKRRGEL